MIDCAEAESNSQNAKHPVNALILLFSKRVGERRHSLFQCLLLLHALIRFDPRTLIPLLNKPRKRVKDQKVAVALKFLLPFSGRVLSFLTSMKLTETGEKRGPHQ
jgi:hypothetical protein